MTGGPGGAVRVVAVNLQEWRDADVCIGGVPPGGGVPG